MGIQVGDTALEYCQPFTEKLHRGIQDITHVDLGYRTRSIDQSPIHTEKFHRGPTCRLNPVNGSSDGSTDQSPL